MRCRTWMAGGLLLAGFACAQNLTEFGAAAATGAAGGVGGKSISDGITAVFGKVNDQTKAAAKQGQTKQDKTATAPATATTSASPAASPTASPSASAASPAASSPGPSAPAPRPKPVTTSKAKLVKTARSAKVERPSVPDPPAPPTHAVVVSRTPPPAPRPEPAAEPAPVLPPPPPPPQVTAENLKSIAPGTAREDVLKLGAPASRITMFGDDGHLLEIYSYMTKGATFGVVRLSDGAVSKVELR